MKRESPKKQRQDRKALKAKLQKAQRKYKEKNAGTIAHKLTGVTNKHTHLLWE